MNQHKTWGVLATAAALLAIPSARAVPDLSGVWEVATKVQELETVDGKAPPLKKEARRIYEEHRAKWQAHDLSYDPTAQCVSPGIPRILFLPYPFKIIQRPRRITYLFEWNYWNRHVDLGGHAMEAPYPLSLGESAGHWEGDTLVIHTNGLRADNTMLDTAGMPHSEDLEVTERLRLIDGGRQLEDRIGLKDPQTFTQPWETLVKFDRLPDGYEIPLDICLKHTDAGQPAVDWARPLRKAGAVR